MFGSGVRCANAERGAQNAEPNAEIEHEQSTENLEA
jgi:hypothetical protein